MGKVQFNTRDAELLYSFPKPAADVATIVWCFTFINRAAPPTYDEFLRCLTKGQRVGIIREEGGKFVIENDWYDRIHAADSKSENEIEAMLEFEDAFVGVDFEEAMNAERIPSEEEYKSILTKLR